MHKHINIVRANLRSRGYRVRTASEFYANPAFDLLVEGRFNVWVTSNREKPQGKDDVNVVVSEGTGAFKGKYVITYYSKNDVTNVPSVVFGLPMSKAKSYEKGKEAEKVGGKKDRRKGGTTRDSRARAAAGSSDNGTAR